MGSHRIRATSRTRLYTNPIVFGVATTTSLLSPYTNTNRTKTHRQSILVRSQPKIPPGLASCRASGGDGWGEEARVNPKAVATYTYIHMYIYISVLLLWSFFYSFFFPFFFSFYFFFIPFFFSLLLSYCYYHELSPHCSSPLLAYVHAISVH